MSKLSVIIFAVIYLKGSAAKLDITSRIYSGTPVGGLSFENGKSVVQRSSTEYPYVVELDSHGSQWCGGTLIREDAVLTAAHCFSSPKGITVRAGHVFRESEKAPGLQKRTVNKVIHHPGYVRVDKGKSKSARNDLAILKLDEPFNMTEYVSVVEYSTRGERDYFKGKVGTILGWGATEIINVSPILLRADLVVMEKEKCEEEINEFNDSYLCAIGKRKKGGLGGGDSGGPFVIHHQDHPENDLLIGVISFGFDKYHPIKTCETVCDETGPSVMTNVGFHSKWIESTLNSI